MKTAKYKHNLIDDKLTITISDSDYLQVIEHLANKVLDNQPLSKYETVDFYLPEFDEYIPLEVEVDEEVLLDVISDIAERTNNSLLLSIQKSIRNIKDENQSD